MEKNNKKKKIIIIISSIFVVCISIGLFLLFGPYSGFRDFWITTAMTTMEHQYLARMFYSDELINEVLEKNSVIEPEGTTDTNLIEIYDNTTSETVYKDKYDKQVLVHEPGQLYKYFEHRYILKLYLIVVFFTFQGIFELLLHHLLIHYTL